MCMFACGEQWASETKNKKQEEYPIFVFSSQFVTSAGAWYSWEGDWYSWACRRMLGAVTPEQSVCLCVCMHLCVHVCVVCLTEYSMKTQLYLFNLTWIWSSDDVVVLFQAKQSLSEHTLPSLNKVLLLCVISVLDRDFKCKLPKLILLLESLLIFLEETASKIPKKQSQCNCRLPGESWCTESMFNHDCMMWL